MGDVFTKIIAVGILTYGLCAIVFSGFIKMTDVMKSAKNIIRNIKKRKENRYKFKGKQRGKLSIRIKRIIIKRIIIKGITINSIMKFEIILYITSASIIVITPKIYMGSSFIQALMLICFVIILIGVGRFISFRRKNELFIDKVHSYVFKFGIYSIYSLSFATAYLEKLNNKFLFLLSIFMLLIYSICFLKYVIDDFKSFIFLICNLIFVYLNNLFIIGIVFGIFYSNNNDIFKMYINQAEILNDFTVNNLILVINNGLHYFYTYPEIFHSNDTFKNCIPFFEYIFGATFNVAIIGFFISYTASKTFLKNSGDNVNIYEQLKNREIKITLKKE